MMYMWNIVDYIMGISVYLFWGSRVIFNKKLEWCLSSPTDNCQHSLFSVTLKRVLGKVRHNLWGFFHFCLWVWKSVLETVVGEMSWMGEMTCLVANHNWAWPVKSQSIAMGQIWDFLIFLQHEKSAICHIFDHYKPQSGWFTSYNDVSIDTLQWASLFLVVRLGRLCF